MAQRILRRLMAQVDQQRHAKARASFRTATDEWAASARRRGGTRESYEQYVRTHLYPAFGDEPIGVGDHVIPQV